jgi:Domain of unknown function (DUF4159)
MAPATTVPATRPLVGADPGAAAPSAAGAVVADVVDGVDFEQPVNTTRTVVAKVSLSSLSSLPKRIVVSSFIAAVLAASAASAQQIWVGRGRFWRTPPKWAKPENFDGAFNFCRAYFSSDRREDGGTGWDTDFPGADNNFSVRLAELTMMRVKLDKAGQPDYVVVKLTDPLMNRCAILHFEDSGTVRFSPDEVQNLRDYLLKGGFITVDDFWGTQAWNQWAEEIGRVLPEYPVVDIPLNHPIMHTLYDVKEIEQVSSIQFWSRNGGSVSERAWMNDSPTVNFRGIADEKGRLMVVMIHDSDIPDGWEREGEEKEYFLRFSPDSYSVGIDVLLYGLTH